MYKPHLINRRSFIASTFSALGLALASRPTMALAGGRAPKNVVVFACLGGWDAMQVFDPKEGDDVTMFRGRKARGEGVLGALPYYQFDIDENKYKTHYVQTVIDAFHRKMVIVNGIDVGSLGHAPSRCRILTGTDFDTSPDFAAMTACDIGGDLPLPYVDLGGNGFLGPLGRLSGRFGTQSQITALVDPNHSKAFWKAAPDAKYKDTPLYVPDTDDEAAIADYVLARAQKQLEGRAQLGYNRDRVQDFIESYDRGVRLGSHLGQLPAAGTFTDLAAQVALVPDLLSGSSPLSRTVFLDSRLPWDTHYNNETTQIDCYMKSFEALGTLLTNLETADLLDDTLVVVLSEMGRTPAQNSEDGKDHWPTTSALLIGGGLQGDRVLGATDEYMSALPINDTTGLADDNGRMLTSTDFVASILDWVGVDSASWLPDGLVLPALAGA